ncbi:uncharacterized protein [Typha angustifolia]|uniref:uncharacterized protein isoform X3 n=1 Tax=Typha angustifolia TaxID=59011 RepID=UPI003C2E274B
MAKQNKPKKPENLGKGKVTPVQVAFIVDRYLADNNYTNALTAFRAEASDLFSKTKGKEVPKGLLGLGEILDEYICLKEQRVVVDQEKRRVEMAMQGMQDVMRAYHAVGNASLPSSPPLLPPQFVGTPVAPMLPALYPNSGSPPGHSINVSPAINYVQNSSNILQKAAETNNLSTPITGSSVPSKRKASKSAPKVPPAPKKPCTNNSSLVSSMIDKALPCQMTTNTTEEKIESTKLRLISHPITRSPIQGSSVAKSLFKPPESQINSSPGTPQQAFPPQPDKSSTPMEKPSNNVTNAIVSEELSSKCSVISSETIIVSPLKGTSIYAVERSYRITSPFKSNMKKLGKREHVKGKLDFDKSDVQMSSEELHIEKASTSSSEVEKEGAFDFDLSDFDIFDGDFSFSELLVDLDLDCDGIPSFQHSSALVDSIPSRSEQNVDAACSVTDQLLHDKSKLAITGDVDIRGPESVTSVRAITKRIKILSPVKTKDSLVEQICRPKA